MPYAIIYNPLTANRNYLETELFLGIPASNAPKLGEWREQGRQLKAKVWASALSFLNIS